MSVLNGLVLIGGQSTRMGSDKALLQYHGKSQLERSTDLLRACCYDVFISKRADQPVPEQFESSVIIDAVGARGPLAGICSAFKHQANCAWLVIACDLPYLNEEALRYLIDRRQPAKLATAYRSVYTGDPEPLCAIYEPEMSEIVQKSYEQGYMCPRRILKEHDTFLLDPPNRLWLENINTPQEKQKFLNKHK